MSGSAVLLLVSTMSDRSDESSIIGASSASARSGKSLKMKRKLSSGFRDGRPVRIAREGRTSTNA